MSLFDELIHYWALGEAAAASRLDTVGTCHLIETGGNVASAAGLHGNAANGNNDVKYLSSVAQTRAGLNDDLDFSIALWIKMVGWPAGALPVFTGATAYDPKIAIDAFGDVQFYTNISGTFAFLPLGDLSVWHLLCLKSEAGVWSGSVDGDPFIGSPGVLTNQFSFTLLGAGTAFNGMVDEMGIWNRALTDAEAALLWNGGTGNFPDTYNQSAETNLQRALKRPTATVVILL